MIRKDRGMARKLMQLRGGSGSKLMTAVKISGRRENISSANQNGGGLGVIEIRGSEAAQ